MTNNYGQKLSEILKNPFFVILRVWLFTFRVFPFRCPADSFLLDFEFLWILGEERGRSDLLLLEVERRDSHVVEVQSRQEVEGLIGLIRWGGNKKLLKKFKILLNTDPWSVWHARLVD